MAVVEAQSRSIRFDRISIEHGLSQATVNCILQDHVGFMWVGTQDGLNRYDGHHFEVYRSDPNDPTTLSNDFILSLAEDEAGNLWVGTHGGGLSLWHPASATFSRFNYEPEDPTSLSGNSVWVIHQEAQDRLWIGTEKSGLNLFDPASGVFERFRHDPSDPTSLSDDSIRAIYSDRQGQLWIGTLNGLNLFDRSTRTFRHFTHDPHNPASLSDSRVRSILEDRQGNIWIGTFSGLDLLNRTTQSFSQFRHDPSDLTSLSGNLVKALYEDHDGRLWVGTEEGLNLMEWEKGRFTRYQHALVDPTSLSGNHVVTITEDRSGILWIGTLAGGINKWSPVNWSFGHYKSDPSNPNGLSGDNAFALSEDHENKLWIGTLGGGLNQLDRKTGEVVVYRHDSQNPGSLSDDRVTSLLHDRRGTLWVGTKDGGLNHFEPTTRSFKRYLHDPAQPGTLGSNGVMSLYEDRDGVLWVGTFRGGLSRFDDETETFTTYRYSASDPTSLSDDRVSSLTEDNQGNFWIGTLGGLNRFDRQTGAFSHHRHEPMRPTSLSHDQVMSLHSDSQGELWIGTRGGGLNHFRRDDIDMGRAIFKNYSERDGLPSKIVWGIYSDAEGTLWLSTNNGLTRFDPRSENFKNYNDSHGLQSNEFNLGAHYQSTRGELFFGGVNGFNAFFPDQLEINSRPPPVVLTSFLVFNRPVDLRGSIDELEEVTLSYRDNVFSFEFAALEYTAPEKNQYAYKLDGLTTDWIDLGNQRQVTLANLDPGGYTLRIKASNNDGVWNEEGTSVRIVVVPPWWKTWWAYGFYGLVLIVALVSIDRVQRNRLIKRERQRTQMREARLRAEAAEFKARALQIENERNAQELEKARELEWAYDELEEKNQEILRAEAQLIHSEKMASLGQLVAGVAHELNNPINFISSGLPSLQRDVAKLTALVPKEERGRPFEKAEGSIGELLEVIQEGARRTAEIVKNLRTFSRLEEAAVKTIDIHDSLNSTLGLLHNQTKHRIRVVRDYGTIPLVECYVSQLNQVFMNLLVNAIQAIQGEGTIIITTAKVDDEADRVQISIRDTGKGMTKDVRQKIFDPFFTTKTVGKGTGLGLSISHGIIEKHHGTIEIESAPGRGAEFTMTLPVRLPSREDEPG